MEITNEIKVKRSKQSRVNDVDFDALEFGKYVSDHMFVCDYKNGEWLDPQVVAYGDLTLSPAILGLHYGQTVFEGMKAFRFQNERINIFRIEKHYDRFSRSLDRMCMPVPPKEMFMEGLSTLVQVDKPWIPSANGSSLYIRPFMFATEAKFGVKISDEYKFIIFSGPVPELYINPIRVKVETKYIRAAKGGTGFAKCGGNYGGAYFPTAAARSQGYDQVLWTDGKPDAAIEESGTMNVMFIIEDTLVTPPLSDSILDGITRDSLLQLAADSGLKTSIRPVKVNDLLDAFRTNSISSAFGAGTAAVIAPIKTIGINGTDHHLPLQNENSPTNQLKLRLEKIRTGKINDIHGWNFII
jgi:branched-chain amino acid aminotransferase